MSAKQVNINKWKEIPCECGKMAKKATLRYKHYEVRGWKCSACKREYIHPEDSIKISRFEKIRKVRMRVKVGVVGQSKVIRIPKELSDVYGLEKGEKVELVPETLKKLGIRKE